MGSGKVSFGLDSNSLLRACWPVPAHIHLVTTLRSQGFSAESYQDFNLATHVDDSAEHVQKNRRILSELLQVKKDPFWVNQVHGTEVLEARHSEALLDADASFADESQQICVVLTADCLPVAFYNESNDRIAVAHAGWRGLASGILEATLRALGPGRTHTWLGPAIGPDHFEVGMDVVDAFVRPDPSLVSAFTARDAIHWGADLYALAKAKLMRAGVVSVSGGGWCTYCDATRFYSFRRDRITGRMATCIWKD